MANQTWRIAFGAALAAAAGLICSAAQAIVYPINYDPPTGPGTVQVRNEICLTDSEVRCVLDLLTTDVLDSNGDEWLLSSPFLDVADPEGSILVDTEAHRLVAFDSRPVTLDLVTVSDIVVEASVSLRTDADNSCSVATLLLFSNATTSLVSCAVDDRGVYDLGPALAPEPASIALVLGGAGAAWLVRRRKQISR